MKGNINIVVSNGIGPVMVMGDGRRLAWVEQDAGNARYHHARFDIY